MCPRADVNNVFILKSQDTLSFDTVLLEEIARGKNWQEKRNEVENGVLSNLRRNDAALVIAFRFQRAAKETIFPTKFLCSAYTTSTWDDW